MIKHNLVGGALSLSLSALIQISLQKWFNSFRFFAAGAASSPLLSFFFHQISRAYPSTQIFAFYSLGFEVLFNSYGQYDRIVVKLHNVYFFVEFFRNNIQRARLYWQYIADDLIC